MDTFGHPGFCRDDVRDRSFSRRLRLHERTLLPTSSYVVEVVNGDRQYLREPDSERGLSGSGGSQYVDTFGSLVVWRHDPAGKELPSTPRYKCSNREAT